MEEAKELLYIIRSYIKNENCQATTGIDEKKLYDIAKANKVSNFLYVWAKNYASEEIKQAVAQDYNSQIIRDTNENIELEKILEKFEEAGLKVVVVKGAIMKEVYPQNYMRQMCDIDILVNHKDFKKASKIMQNLGFDQFYDHEKHLVFTKGQFLIVEMHRKLIPGGDVGSRYFNNIWGKCVKYKNYENVYRMTIEEAYVFCIIHLIRHFKYAGIQVRDVLDVYLYYEKYKEQFDFAKISQMLKEFSAKEFEENIRKIAYKWFGSEKITDFDEVEKFILNGSNINNWVDYSVGESQGKKRFIAKLLFPSYKIMAEKYPVLKKVPVLLPFAWGMRILKDIFSKETTIKARLNTIKLIGEAKPEEVERIHNIYKKLNIK